MFKKFFVGTVAAAALVVSANSASAQASERPITFGVAAGVSLPSGDFADAYKAGYNAALSAAFKSPLSPVTLRIEGGYDNFSSKIAGADDFSVFNLSVNAVLNIPNSSPVKPYLIAGAGAYFWDAGASNETDLGFNAGAGISAEMSGFTTFAEARFHFINLDNSSINPKYIPITVGIRF